MLADPEGNEFCVIEPGNKFLADCGFIGAINCDGSQQVGYIWSAALGWPLVWDQETAIRSPHGGPEIAWGGPPLMPKTRKDRLHFDLAPPAHGDRQAEVDRLVSLGATRLDIGQGEVDWVVLADPDGNEFCALDPFDRHEPGHGARMSGAWRSGWLDEWPGKWRSRRCVRHGRPSAPYNRWVNPPLTSSDQSLALPADLTVDEAVRIADAITAAHADSTRTMYAWAWSHWERWCTGRGTTALPAEPALVCAYLTERAAEGLSVGTIDLACGAIAYRHRMHGLDDPVLTEGVRQVRRGLRRIIGTAPRRQARPLGTAEIRQITDAIDRTTALGARDAAIILLGYASALRRSELAALTLADVEFKPGGVLLTVRRSKTDQYADGQVVAIVHGRHAATDPITALDAWLTYRGHMPGPLFTSMRNKVVTLDAISGEAISILLRKRARAAGLAAERVTAHSLRAGHATTAAVAGVALDRIAAQTRHKRLSTLIERYIRPAQALEYTSSRDLGL